MTKQQKMPDKIKKKLQSLADSKKAKILSRFFKTGKDEYGEGDVFIGVSVPDQRKIAKDHIDLSLKALRELLHSKIHEHRLTSLLILTNKYKRADKKGRRRIFNLYLKNTSYINNWDLVDLSAHHIVGDYLLTKDKSILYKLARSSLLWERRMSIIATYKFIKEYSFEETLKISKILIYDKHDLIHKAVGWMLREVGKRDKKIEEKFLEKYYRIMPRTMLRYAIEKFSKEKREYYLKS